MGQCCQVAGAASGASVSVLSIPQLQMRKLRFGMVRCPIQDHQLIDSICEPGLSASNLGVKGLPSPSREAPSQGLGEARSRVGGPSQQQWRSLGSFFRAHPPACRGCFLT